MADGYDARDLAQYRQMLVSEIGTPVFNRRSPPRQESPRIGLMFAASLTAFCMVSGLKMWREGRFEFLRPPPPAAVDGRAGAWMLGDRRRVPDDSRTGPVEREPVLPAPIVPSARDTRDPHDPGRSSAPRSV